MIKQRGYIDGAGGMFAILAVICAIAGYLILRGVEWLVTHIHF